MGFGLRKSFKAGPVRITASKSGLSTSVGGKRGRVTRQANGRKAGTAKVGPARVRKTWK